MAKPEAVALVGSLTPREREVFDGLVDGQVARVIAKRLGISPKTLQAHRCAIRAKVGSANAADLARLAMRAGVIQ